MMTFQCRQRSFSWLTGIYRTTDQSPGWNSMIGALYTVDDNPKYVQLRCRKEVTAPDRALRTIRGLNNMAIVSLKKVPAFSYG